MPKANENVNKMIQIEIQYNLFLSLWKFYRIYDGQQNQIDSQGSHNKNFRHWN